MRHAVDGRRDGRSFRTLLWTIAGRLRRRSEQATPLDPRSLSDHLLRDIGWDRGRGPDEPAYRRIRP